MSFGDSFRAAAQRGGGDEFDPPNGNYTVKIVDAGAFAAKTDGREWCKVKLQIIGGDDAGRQFEDFGPAADHGGASFDFMVERLLAYGLDLGALERIEDIGDLDGLLQDLVGREAEVSVSHKGQFRNLSVHGSKTGQSDIPTNGFSEQGAGDVVGPEPQASFSAAAGAKTDDPLPF